MTAGELIRKERRSQDITQEKLSELTGVNENYISRIEKGKVHPRWDVAVKILKTLGVTEVKI